MHALEDSRHAADELSFAPATAPIVPRQVQSRIATSTNPLLRREVFGFAPYWNLSKYNEWNFNLLSTIAYFGLTVNDDGTFMTSGGAWDGWNSADLTNLINKAHLAGARVVLVIKNFNDGSINTIVTNSRPNLIAQTIAAMASKNLDGVNVDFEGSGDPRFPDIQLGITTLMTEMSSAIHAKWPSAEVSIDTFAGSASWDGGIFKIGDLAPVVDAFFIMAYDSVFSNMPGQAGPNAPMGGWTYNDTIDVSQYLTKAPASKIILGVPYYGYRFTTVDGSVYSSLASGKAPAVTYSGVQQDIACGPMALKTGWEATGQTPWLSWWSPRTADPCGDNLASPQEIYYDNATSLGLKYDLVNSNNLRGAGMWTLGYDSGYPDLWNELAVKFTTTTPWFTLNGLLASGPTAASWSASRIDSFVMGTDSGLWQNSWDGTGWSGWGALGGILTSDPAAASWGPNRVDVFVRGSDTALWHLGWNGTSWSRWEYLGGSLTSGPEVASWGVGRLDVFARGGDNGLWHKWWDAAGWHPWEALGGVLTSDPAVVEWGPNRVDVFGRGADNALWHKWWDTTGWHAWERLGGVLSSGPSAASCASGHMDVFAVGADPAMYQIGYNGTWQAWQRLGGQWTADPGAVCTVGATSVDLFERGPDGAMWHTKVPAT